MTPASFAPPGPPSTAGPLPFGPPSRGTPTGPRAAAAPPWTEPAPDRLMRVLGFVVFAYVWRVQDIFPILGTLRFSLLAMAAAVVLFALATHPWRRVAQVRGPILGLVCGLLFIMLAGVPTSLWRSHSLVFALKDYLTNIVLLVLVAASIRSVRDVEWYARVNLYGAMFYATIVNVFFHVGADGRLGNLVYYDANDFALVMVATVPFAVYMLRRDSRTRSRVLGLLALSLFLIGVVKSGSRGGFIGLVAVMMYILIRYRAIRGRTRAFALIAGVGLLATLGSGWYWNQMSTILHPESDYNWTDKQGRKAVWERGLGYVETHPILGVGVGAFPVAEGRLSAISRDLASRGRGFKWSAAHNSFLETAAELGIPGLLVFLSLLGVAALTLARVRPGRRYGPWISKRETALAQMLLGSLIGFSISGFFVSAEYFSYLYLLLGITLGLHKVLRLQRDAGLAALARMMPVRRPSAGPVPPPVAVARGS